MTLKLVRLTSAVLLASQVHATAIDCLTRSSSSTLTKLINCFNGFTVPHDFYNPSTYAAAQPTTNELNGWIAAVNTLLSTDGDCSSAVLDTFLAPSYRIDLFTEREGAFKSYCILSEKSATSGVYNRGWGLMVVPATTAAISRTVHFSAPHPLADFNTPQQAAELFGATGGRSLLIHGRNRTAYYSYSDSPTCCVPGPTGTTYYKCDAAHDNTQPFFNALMTIRTYQNLHGGCPNDSCAYLQLHGKGTGADSCPSDAIFLSAGLGNGAASVAWYTDDTDRPIKRLKTELQHVFSGTIALPSDDTSCDLTATRNIFGRVLNGVPFGDICIGSASQFIHAEQAKDYRLAPNYDEWTTAIQAAL
ncbi:hypothetical protein BDN72DRAFT_870674 [Pluteus cervinus]|uniref:Uncharacterized protein n=1 Tax=Pluteus cervinus TaxID=181527 RepID=A0ACD3AVN3_9AGAR|nr:hypothetical protein BDN72DRAFT_870674 [Pluteus cervinus]